ncbi:uncharacterized protein LOC141618679 [Silene latifolia]|uniref:uncharacterized protein LOC141618679 n=1 Tax=Silene latifolia TaxID=37657 RepID=UPI003D7825A6
MNPNYGVLVQNPYSVLQEEGPILDTGTVEVPLADEPPDPEKRFSYLNYWEEHPDYGKAVKEAWDIPVRGNTIYRLFSRLKNVRQRLIDIHKNFYSGISGKVQEAQKNLHDCQSGLQANSLDPAMLAMEHDLLQTYLILKKAEHSSLLQRAKIQNITYNDAPTSYYFLELLLGSIKWLLGQHSLVDSSQMESFDGPRFPESGCEEICREVDDKEIKLSLFSIAFNKSPGQDGFSAQFFKTSWDTIELEFCNAVKGFFISGNISKQANTTLLALIPKKLVVSTIMDYRPIACCTVFYKTISKILCSRLKPFLPDLVGKE